jgi:hypothetical protein
MQNRLSTGGTHIPPKTANQLDRTREIFSLSRKSREGLPVRAPRYPVASAAFTERGRRLSVECSRYSTRLAHMAPTSRAGHPHSLILRPAAPAGPPFSTPNLTSQFQT